MAVDCRCRLFWPADEGLDAGGGLAAPAADVMASLVDASQRSVGGCFGHELRADLKANEAECSRASPN
jgi:hypothetical protein